MGGLVDLPPETFRVRPRRRSRRYFVVHIAPSLRKMAETMRRCGYGSRRNQLACCIAIAVNNSGVAGVLFFAEKALGAGLVSHEMAHAAFRYCELRGARIRHWEHDHKNATKHEEFYAKTAEMLNREFWKRFYLWKLPNKV